MPRPGQWGVALGAVRLCHQAQSGNMFLISTDLCPLLGALGILTYLPRGHGSVDELRSPAAHSDVGEVKGCPVAETRRFWGAGARLVFPDKPSPGSGLP